VHKARPSLVIEVYVDWHRARRGLIGKVASEGNATLCRDYAARWGDGVAIYGVPVQNLSCSVCCI
jgi:CDP-diacylglycerol---serine O-phosphatidyltransferase